VKVVRGPEYQITGVVQSVNIPNTRLTILSDSDHALVSSRHLDSNTSNLSQIDVPIGFVSKLRNTSVDEFKHVLNKEVFIIGGSLKGYRATLCDISQENCTVAIHGQKRTVLKRSHVVTK
jgi:transcription elongation factor